MNRSIAIVATALLSGCGGFHGTHPQTLLACDFDALEDNSRRNGPALVASAYDSVTAIPLGAVVVSNEALFRSVIAQSITSAPTESGSVQVSVRFANCTPGPMQLRARTNFLNAQGAPVENASAWQTVFLSPSLTGVYQESSLTRGRASSFYVEIEPNR